MELYTRIFDNNLCIAHFSFTYEEAMHIYQEVEKYIDDNLDIEEHFIKAIEIKYINEALEEKELVCVGEKEIRILSDLRENQPYVLVARFLVLPEVVNLSLPINIPYSLKCDVNKKINNVSDFFKVKLLSNDLAQLQDVDVIDLDCIVRYDLRFIIDGEIISVYDNQILEMYKDVELQPERFVGAKINDAVAISDVEGVVTDFLIRKIQKKIPYNETTDKSIFIDLGYNDYFDLLDKFKKSFERVTRVESYIDYIVDFIYENTKLEYSKEINNFYKELDYFAYDKEYENESIFI